MSTTPDPNRTTHTPGPWWAGQQATGDWLIQSGDPSTHEPPWAVTEGTLGAIRGSDHAEANAYLIAAAPDLLSASKEALALLEAIRDRPTDNTQRFIAAAIAKAEGR